MLATAAIDKTVSRPLALRFDPGLVESDSDYSVLLKLALSNLAVAVAAVYRFDPKVHAFDAVAWQASAGLSLRSTVSVLTADDARYLRQLRSPVQCGSGGQLFESFPEAIHCEIERLLIAPLLLNDKLMGLFTLGRAEAETFTGDQLDIALVGSRLLKVMFERDDLEQNLASRKLIERAKGILQRTRRITEEQSYITLRNMSRCRQCAMSDVARDIITADLRKRSHRQPLPPPDESRTNA